jgi:hypothetical protein
MTKSIECRKPKTHRGKRMLAKREPKIVELAKQSLMLRGATASTTSLQFVKDLVLFSIVIYVFLFMTCHLNISFSTSACH